MIQRILSFWGRLMSKTSFRLVLSLLACWLLTLPAFANSQARIVRLSDVQGSVQIDKNSGLGFERAFLNLPVTQGTQLKTGSTGRAEIEFEDGSTLRLAPNTKVEVTALTSNDAGKHLSVINLSDGMAYVNWLGKSGDIVTLNFSQQKIELASTAHFRLETTPSVAKLAVFKGDVDVTGPSETVAVSKKKMAIFDESDNGKSTFAKVEETPFDSWDKESIEYHDQYAKNNTTPYGYGFSDLGYYGAFSNVAGYGMMWQPYFTGVGWDPFMDGAWSFYPGMGYMFVSAYPWGWMPYYYGNWMFVPGFGWMWQPGYFNSFVSVPRYVHPTTAAAVFHPPVPPTGTKQTVIVGHGGPVTGKTTLLSSRMVVSKGSAGLGIARGSISDMKHVNSQVAKSGSVEMHSTPQFATTSTGRSSMGSGGYGGASHASAPMSAGHASGSMSAGHASSGGGSHH